MKSDPGSAGTEHAAAETSALEQRVAHLEAELARERQRVAALEEREARYRETFDRAAVGIAHVSLDGRFMYVNRRVSEILGYTREELSSLTFFQLTHPDDSPETSHNHRGLTTDEIPRISVEKRYLHKKGHAVWVHLVSTPVRDTETGDPYYLSIFDDISTRKRADDFQRAMQAAQAANHAKGRFLANMSHEIRTPVNGIMSMTEFVLQSELSEEQRDCLDTVMSSAHALLDIINNVLDLSKIEAGKLELERIGFSLRETLSSALKPLELQAKDRALDLGWDVRADVPDRLYGDPGRLRQILLNLVGNALKFTPQGHVRLDIDTIIARPRRVTLRFSVADTGIGISPDRQQHIFTPFEQADGSTTRVFGGTGLGLSIAAELVKKMGGELGVESQLEVGSTFRFTAQFDCEPLPTAAPTPRRITTEVRPLRAPSRPVPAAAGASRILLVDDNDVNRKATSRILRRRGYIVELAVNGKHALDLLEGTTVDLVLMDVQMPEMDGLEATRALRKREQATGAHTTVVGLTACAMDGDDQRCLESGMDGYLSKPYSLDQIYETIERYLGRGRNTSK